MSDRPQCTAARRRCSAAAAAAAATTNGPASALRLLLIGEHPHLYGVCKVHSNCHVTGVPAAARAGGCGPRCTADRVPRRPRHRWRPVAVRRRLRLRTVENVGWRLGPAGEAGRGTDCRCDFVAFHTGRRCGSKRYGLDRPWRRLPLHVLLPCAGSCGNAEKATD